MVVDYDGLGMANLGDLNSNGYIDYDEVDLDAVLDDDDPTDNPEGIFSLDYLHLTNTGYALYANEFIKRINEAFGADVPLIDVAAVFATDPLAPRNFTDEVLDYAGVPH